MQWVHLCLFKRQANHFVVETKDAQQRLKKKLKTIAVEMVSNTCGSQYFSPATYPNKLPSRTENEIRFITITGYYVHKNLESIPNVLEELSYRNISNVTFTLTLKKDDYERIIPAEWRSRVHNVGSVPTIECPSLYKECDMLYLPTLLEVFSASYPEAMVMQKPILTSDLSFAHSICGKSALYFDPFSAKDIADKIETIINNQTLQKKLILEGEKQLATFGTARNRAEKYLQLCESIC
jgi:glycosyltransferase involved in cell wall biosynthesis